MHPVCIAPAIPPHHHNNTTPFPPFHAYPITKLRYTPHAKPANAPTKLLASTLFTNP